MDLRYLQSFLAVVDHGSLVEAARRLDMTPTALSARIHALENELGIQVLKRSGRTVKVSQAGLKIIDRARALVRDVRDLQTVAVDGAVQGELRLGVFVSAMTDILPRVLAQLYEDHADLHVFVFPGTSVDLCRKVASGALDAAIVVEPQFTLGKNCEWRTVVKEVMVTVAHTSLGEKDAHTLLQTEPFIRYDRSVVGGQLADRYLRDHGLWPNQRLELDGMMAIAELVAHGLGVSLLPDWAPMWNSTRPIARIPLPHPSPIRQVGMVWDTHSPRVSLAKAALTATQNTWAQLLRQTETRRLSDIIDRAAIKLSSHGDSL